MPGFLVMPFVPFVASLFLVVRPGAPSSVLVPSSKDVEPYRSLLVLRVS